VAESVAEGVVVEGVVVGPKNAVVAVEEKAVVVPEKAVEAVEGKSVEENTVVAAKNSTNTAKTDASGRSSNYPWKKVEGLVESIEVMLASVKKQVQEAVLLTTALKSDQTSQTPTNKP
jgi:hypothetical protein